MRAPKVIIEDRLTEEQKKELSATIAQIPTTLSPVDYSSALSACRQEAQRKAGKEQLGDNQNYNMPSVRLRVPGYMAYAAL